jgi:hypothetical protein
MNGVMRHPNNNKGAAQNANTRTRANQPPGPSTYSPFTALRWFGESEQGPLFYSLGKKSLTYPGTFGESDLFPKDGVVALTSGTFPLHSSGTVPPFSKMMLRLHGKMAEVLIPPPTVHADYEALVSMEEYTIGGKKVLIKAASRECVKNSPICVIEVISVQDLQGGRRRRTTYRGTKRRRVKRSTRRR